MKTQRRQPTLACPSGRKTAERNAAGNASSTPPQRDSPRPGETSPTEDGRATPSHPPEAGQDTLAAALVTGLSQLQLEASETQRRQLLDHLALVQHWGRIYNLTAIRDGHRMLVHHLIDSLSIVPGLRRHLAERSHREMPQRLLDVGSGAGLPGVAIAIMLPAVEVCCVDTVAKKATFITQVAAELGLANLRAAHARVEAMVDTPYDVITSRAFASLQDFVAWTRHLLAPEGVWLAMKGRIPTTELGLLVAGVDAFHVEPLRVPGLDAERCLVWMRQSTSSRPSSFAPLGTTPPL